MSSLDTIKFNISDYIRRKYIWNELRDYEEYIKREKQVLEKEISELNKQHIISNISMVYCEMGEYKKAIETIRLLDNYELNDNMTFIYYINSLTYYIYINHEENADYIYDVSHCIMKKFYEKYADEVDLYNIRYLNFKGRYEESLEILKSSRIKDKNDDYTNLLLADIAFNTNQFDEGYFLINEMCREYGKKNPCIRKQIDTLINVYITKIPVEKNEALEPASLDKKLWDKVKNSRIKTSLFFTYLYLKNMCKVKSVKYVVIPTLLTIFLCKVFFPLVYGNTYSDVFIHLISFIFLMYFAGGLGYITTEHTK
ncbi:MAG TPA: hypothetical protein DG753_12675, partial [Clostridium sp.]|nr:hypothetical protein [Clostridium sp.]